MLIIETFSFIFKIKFFPQHSRRHLHMCSRKLARGTRRVGEAPSPTTTACSKPQAVGGGSGGDVGVHCFSFTVCYSASVLSCSRGLL